MSKRTTTTSAAVNPCWRAIPGHPNYEWTGDISIATSLRVRRAAGGRGARSGRVLKPYFLPSGRAYWMLSANQKRFAYLRSVLVLTVGAGPRPKIPGCTVDACHNDGDLTNDNITNLRWDTRSNNQLDRREHGNSNGGSRNGRCKLTQEQAAAVFYASGYQHDIAAAFGVSRVTVSDIKRKRTWGTINLALDLAL
jgi:hypothetical protein